MKCVGTYKPSSRLGFTIVELLIVIVVIAVLAAIVIVSYNGIRSKAEESSLKSTVSQTAKKIELYAIDNSDLYPTYNTAVGLGIIDSTTGVRYTVASDRKSYSLTMTNGSTYANISNTSASPAIGRAAAHTSVAITNLANNPSASTGSAGWNRLSSGAPGASARTGTGGIQGPDYVLLSHTGTGNGGLYFGTSNATRPDVVAGQTYTVSAYLKSSIPVNIVPTIAWYNTSSSWLSAFDTVGETVAINSVWKRVVVTGTAPATATDLVISWYVQGSPWTNGSTMGGDGLMVTQGTEVYPYSDGDTPGWTWSGTAGASTSSGPSL